MHIACPDCGTALAFRDLFNGTAVCECPNPECRADWMSHWKDRDEAADKFVRLCEEHGYTKALVAKIAALQSACAAPGQGDLFA